MTALCCPAGSDVTCPTGDTHTWVTKTVCSKLNLHLLLKCNTKAVSCFPATFGRTNCPQPGLKASEMQNILKWCSCCSFPAQPSQHPG